MSVSTQPGVAPQPAPRRLPAQARKAAILDRLNQGGSVSVAGIAHDLGVSDMTVRRDLDELERQGQKLERVHGGAVALQRGPLSLVDDVEPQFDARCRLHSETKRRIARAAAQAVAGCQTLAFDLGTTVLAAAREVIADAPQPSLRAFTHSLRVAQLTAGAGVATYLPGGQIQPGEMAIVGQGAIDDFSRYYFDAALIGASGLTPDGLFDYSPEESGMKSVYFRRASRRVVLLDSSKFRHLSTVRVADLSAITTLITDARPPPEIARALDAGDVQLMVV